MVLLRHGVSVSLLRVFCGQEGVGGGIRVFVLLEFGKDRERDFFLCSAMGLELQG